MEVVACEVLSAFVYGQQSSDRKSTDNALQEVVRLEIFGSRQDGGCSSDHAAAWMLKQQDKAQGSIGPGKRANACKATDSDTEEGLGVDFSRGSGTRLRSRHATAAGATTRRQRPG